MGMDFTECENDLKLIIQLDRKKKTEKSGVGLPLTEGGMHKK